MSPPRLGHTCRQEVNILEAQKPSEEKYIQHIYHRIIILAMTAHLAYVVFFALLKLPVLAWYNVASVLFYCAMQWAVYRKAYRLAVSCIHCEVCLFALITTLIAGWGVGTSFYLVALTSLTYFCPFHHKGVPYLFAAMEIVVFLALKLYTSLVCHNVLAVSETAGLWLYLFGACSCFTIILYAAFSSNISAAVSRRELQDENRSLSALANYDQLTGLLSRHAFLSRLEKMKRDLLTLALGDIDNFKSINDTWGHPCGDQVLSEVAELVHQQLGRDADVCRWGGEEFVFLFQGIPPEEAYGKIQGLCDAVAAHTFCSGAENLHITMTFGLTRDTGDLSAEELVASADRKMYQGKARGKNQVVG